MSKAVYFRAWKTLPVFLLKLGVFQYFFFFWAGALNSLSRLRSILAARVNIVRYLFFLAVAFMWHLFSFFLSDVAVASE